MHDNIDLIFCYIEGRFLKSNHIKSPGLVSLWRLGRPHPAPAVGVGGSVARLRLVGGVGGLGVAGVALATPRFLNLIYKYF